LEIFDMARYTILYWKDIPAQEKVVDEAGEISAVLPERFQRMIDAAAMAETSTDEDAYLAGWRLGEEKERDGNAQEVLEVLLAELEADYPSERLVEMARAHKVPPTRGK
jgi:hypothetical protein